MKKFIMNVCSFVKRHTCALAFGLLTLPALAEGESNTGITAANTALEGWVDAAKTAITGWIEKLSPLFLAALGIVLAMAAWAIFKKVTNKAK